MINLVEFHNILQQRKGQKELLLKSKIKLEEEIQQYKRRQRNIENAQLIIQTVAQQTQKEIEIHLSNLISLALSSIYEDPYEFQLKFEMKRGKTEAVPCFVRRGRKYIPGKQTGGGPIDIASFALRLSLWNINKNIINNVFILDEPFKNLDENAIPKVRKLLKFLSKRLKIQFIIITHDTELAKEADKSFKIEKEKNNYELNN